MTNVIYATGNRVIIAVYLASTGLSTFVFQNRHTTVNVIFLNFKSISYHFLEIL